MDVGSIALFGSCARGDSDRLSDSDLLLVSDLRVDREKNAFAREGFSVSSFTWTQFDAMAASGSLFLQHLKLESVLLSDASGRLSSTLRNFKPKRDQSQRIIENQSLFELTSGTPAHINTLGWAFDILAVAVRNHAVLLAAQDGTYLFSQQALVAWLTQKFGLSSSESALLRALRPLKQEYRGTGKVVSADWRQLVSTQALVERIFCVTCAAEPAGLLNFARQRIALNASLARWYLAMRSYEGALRAIQPLLTAEQAAELRCLEEVIRKPSPYSAADFGGLARIQARLNATWQMLVESKASIPPTRRLVDDVTGAD